MKLPWKILIGTHHKTGTIWLHSIFYNICRQLKLEFFAGPQGSLPEHFDVFLEDHSVFETGELEETFRGLHMIRDPRDVIISGCFYHQKADEDWLRVPRRELNGLTYQQKINSFKSIDDRILFEMENTGRQTILDMLNWDYDDDAFYEVRYEELISDEDLLLFHQIFTFLGFPGAVMPGLLAVAYNGSLFSGRPANSAHVRSGRKEQWKKYFRRIHRDRFQELFGDALVQLGYEESDDW